MITRDIVRDHILSYLNQQMTLPQLVDWAEAAVFEEDFELKDTELLMEVVGRLGVADVEHFNLAWEDYYRLLSQLGYHVQVMAV